MLRLPKVATLTKGCYAYQRLLRLPEAAAGRAAAAGRGLLRAARAPGLDGRVVALLVVGARHHLAASWRRGLLRAALGEEFELTLLGDEARRAQALDGLEASAVLLLGHDAALRRLHQVLLLEAARRAVRSAVVYLSL